MLQNHVPFFFVKSGMNLASASNDAYRLNCMIVLSNGYYLYHMDHIFT
jgi:hypothetical protein